MLAFIILRENKMIILLCLGFLDLGCYMSYQLRQIWVILQDMENLYLCDS